MIPLLMSKPNHRSGYPNLYPLIPLMLENFLTRAEEWRVEGAETGSIL